MFASKHYRLTIRSPYPHRQFLTNAREFAEKYKQDCKKHTGALLFAFRAFRPLPRPPLPLPELELIPLLAMFLGRAIVNIRVSLAKNYLITNVYKFAMRDFYNILVST